MILKILKKIYKNTQLGLNKHLQPHKIKSYKHKIKNQANKNRKQKAVCHTQNAHIVSQSYSH